MRTEVKSKTDRPVAARTRTKTFARSDDHGHSLNTRRCALVSSGSYRKRTSGDESACHHMVWDISAISVYTMRIAELLGKRIGVSGPQWMILIAIEELSEGSGLSVKAVAALLHVDSSFVSVQSKVLEKRDLIRRSRCMEDRRIMLLSLTTKAISRLKPLVPTRSRLHESIRADLDRAAFLQLSNMLSDLRDRMRKETELVAAGK